MSSPDSTGTCSSQRSRSLQRSRSSGGMPTTVAPALQELASPGAVNRLLRHSATPHPRLGFFNCGSATAATRRGMVVMKRLWLSPVWLLLACGSPRGYAPPDVILEEEIRVSIAALEHTLARLRNSGEIAASSRLVLAPEPFWGTSGPTSRDSLLVEAVARSVGVVVRPLREVLICPDTCHLNAEVLFQLGRRQIQGDTAYVWVYQRWYNPTFRDPTPMAGHEWILRRGGEGWTAVGSRGIMRS